MEYEITILREAEKDLRQLERQPVYTRVKAAILALAANPRPRGCVKLALELGYRLRIGDYRIVWTVDDSVRIVSVHRVGHRSEVYE